MITRIEATNVFCFSTFEMNIGPKGALVEGGNGEGKTSILNMIRAALVEKGATKDMIKKGASKGEIQVRVNNHVVKRVMNGGDKFRTTLRVTDETGKVVPEPATFLKNLLGLSPLDPIELFLEKDKGKRRAKILSAIPCSVTAEQLAAWCPPGTKLVDILGADPLGGPNVEAHGLEVIERVRKDLYGKRTDANRVVKERQTALDHATAKESAAYDALSAFRVENALPEKALELSIATQRLNDAKVAEISLAEQARAAEQSAKAQARTREKIAALRQKAADLRANQPIAPTEDQFNEAAAETSAKQREVSAARAAVEELETKLAEAKAVLNARLTELDDLKAYENKLAECAGTAGDIVDEIANLEDQALELEQALGALPVAPSQAQFEEAERHVRQASALVEYARKSAEVATHAEAVDRTRVMLKSAVEDAGALDRSVKALADDAPAALLAAADGIKGLTIDGDDIFLDGVALDQLSGQERLFFAIEVARRLNAKSRLLCVDGLEALDAEHRAIFIAKATEGGFQLIATRVAEEGGEPVAMPLTDDPLSRAAMRSMR